MKKLLALFVVLDLVFVGVVLTLGRNQDRRVASTQEGLTEGQQKKKELIESLKFFRTDSQLILQTEKLPDLCAGYKYLRLSFSAEGVAISGQVPVITHAYSCADLQAGETSLTTEISAFAGLAGGSGNAVLSVAPSLFLQEFPEDWSFSGLEVTGADPQSDHFTVNAEELRGFVLPEQKENLKFKITSEK